MSKKRQKWEDDLDNLRDLSEILSNSGGMSAAEEAARKVDELPPVKPPPRVSLFWGSGETNSHNSSASSSAGSGCGCLILIILFAIFCKGC